MKCLYTVPKYICRYFQIAMLIHYEPIIKHRLRCNTIIQNPQLPLYTRSKSLYITIVTDNWFSCLRSIIRVICYHFEINTEYWVKAMNYFNSVPQGLLIRIGTHLSTFPRTSPPNRFSSEFIQKCKKRIPEIITIPSSSVT